MKYIDDIKQKPTHERRTHAMQMAGAIVAAVFIVWVSTIAIRLATEDPAVAQGGDDSSLANVASGAAASNGQATLLVSTSTDYSAQQ